MSESSQKAQLDALNEAEQRAAALLETAGKAMGMLSSGDPSSVLHAENLNEQFLQQVEGISTTVSRSINTIADAKAKAITAAKQ